MSTLKTTNLVHPSSSSNNIVLDNTGKVSIAEKKLYCPGTIIQVLNTTVTDTNDTTLSTAEQWYNLDELNVTITPTAASSKFLINVFSMGEANVDDHALRFSLGRTVGGSLTMIGIGDAASNRTQVMGVVLDAHYNANSDSTPTYYTIPNYMDSPNTTSAVTYGVYMASAEASKTWSGNSTVNSSDDAGCERGCSWMTVMEVAG